jgi:hypothetical protein
LRCASFISPCRFGTLTATGAAPPAAVHDAERAVADRLAEQLDAVRVEPRRRLALEEDRHGVDRAGDVVARHLDVAPHLARVVEHKRQLDDARLARRQHADAGLGGEVVAALVAARRHGDGVVDALVRVVDEHHLVLQLLVDGAARAARDAKQRHRVVAQRLVERALLGLERRHEQLALDLVLLADGVELVRLVVGAPVPRLGVGRERGGGALLLLHAAHEPHQRGNEQRQHEQHDDHDERDVAALKRRRGQREHGRHRLAAREDDVVGLVGKSRAEIGENLLNRWCATHSFSNLAGAQHLRRRRRAARAEFFFFFFFFFFGHA